MKNYIKAQRHSAYSRKTSETIEVGCEMPRENYEDEFEEEVDSHLTAEEDEEEFLEDDDELTVGEQGFIKGCELADKKDADED